MKGTFRKGLNFLFRRAANQQWFLTVGREEQLRILCSFPEPRDRIERSYFQYRCQIHRYSLFIRFVLNVLSAFAIPYYLLRRYKTNSELTENNRKKAVFLCDGFDLSLVPSSLSIEYDDISELPYVGKMYLSAADKSYWIDNVWRRYWLRPYFVLKILLRIAAYSYSIDSTHCAAVISYSEYSFASSALTDYCSFVSVEHINVMHGEKLFDISNAFVSYHRFYVWDTHYVELFRLLRASVDRFVCATPDAIMFDGGSNWEKALDYTYYLQGLSRVKLKKVSCLLEALVRKGYRVAVRPHPRFTLATDINLLTGSFLIEDASKISIEESIKRTKCAIGIASTVFIQAALNGTSVVVDDLTDPQRFQVLKELEYRFATDKQIKLSDILLTEEIVDC